MKFYCRAFGLLVALCALAPTPAWAVMFGPSDWGKNAEVIVFGTVSTIEKSTTTVKQYFLQPEEVWKGTLTADQKMLLEVYAVQPPAADSFRVVVFLVRNNDPKQTSMLQIAALALPPNHLDEAKASLKEWIQLSETPEYKALPAYRELLLKNIAGDHPVLQRCAADELFYVGYALTAEDNAVLRTVYHATENDAVRAKICLSFITTGDAALSPVLLHRIGTTAEPEKTLTPLQRFRPIERSEGREKERAMYEALAGGITERLRQFDRIAAPPAPDPTLPEAEQTKLREQLQAETGAAAQATAGLTHANYLIAAGELRVSAASEWVLHAFKIPAAPADVTAAALVAAGKLKLPECRAIAAGFLVNEDPLILNAAYRATACLQNDAAFVVMQNTLAPEAVETQPAPPATDAQKLAALGALREFQSKAIHQSMRGQPEDATDAMLANFEGKLQALLAAVFQREQNPGLLHAAIELYAESAKGDALDAMGGLIRRPELPEPVLHAVLGAIGSRKIKTYKPEVWALLKDAKRPATTRSLCVQVIAAIGTKKDREELTEYIKALRDE